jgi:hypothetical protein
MRPSDRPVVDHDHKIIDFNDAIVIEITWRQRAGAFGDSLIQWARMI